MSQAQQHDRHIHVPDSLFDHTHVAQSNAAFVGCSAMIVGKQVQAAHVCGPESCPSKYQQHVWGHEKHTNSHHGHSGHGAQGKGLNHGRHISGVVGVSSGTCKCQMSFCRDWAKHDEIVRQHTIQLMFHHQQGEYHRQCGWPIPARHYLFRLLWYGCWEDAGTWHWHLVSEISDFGLQACVLSGMLPTSMGRSDSSHQNELVHFMQSPKFPGFSIFRRW